MDRKAFFRNIFGAVAAVTISPVLEKISIAPAPKETLVATYKHIPVGDGHVWMSAKEYEFQQKWMAGIERQYWYGNQGDNKRT